MKSNYLRLAKCLTECVNNRLSDELPEKEEENLFSWIMAVLHYNIYSGLPKSKYQINVKEKAEYKFKKVLLEEGFCAQYISSGEREEFMPILEKVIGEINELEAVNGYRFTAKLNGSKERIKFTVEINPIEN